MPFLTSEEIQNIVKQAEEIPGWMSTAELTWLVERASSLPSGAKWAELGGYCGRSLLAVALALPNGSTLISIDVTWGSTVKKNDSGEEITIHDVFREIFEKRKYEISVHAVRSSSDQAARVYERGYFDVVFIDANHSFASCSSDIANWSPLVTLGGLLCGHDYCDSWPTVQKAVDNLIPERSVAQSIWFKNI